MLKPVQNYIKTFFYTDIDYTRLFFSACEQGDINALFKNLSYLRKDAVNFSSEKEISLLNQGLTICTEFGYAVLGKYLIKQGAKNLNECLKLACEKDRCGMAELLVQEGATPLVGLKVVKSSIIRQMLYRYEQKN